VHASINVAPPRGDYDVISGGASGIN